MILKEIKFIGLILFLIFSIILLVFLVFFITYKRFKCSEYVNFMNNIKISGKIETILPYLPEGFVTSAEKKLGTEEVLNCIARYNLLYNEDKDKK